MWTAKIGISDGEAPELRQQQPRFAESDIACHSCRRRKIKCDRKVPQCRVCQRTQKICEYPARALQPGPKIGTKQKGRKKRRRTGSDVSLMCLNTISTQFDQSATIVSSASDRRPKQVPEASGVRIQETVANEEVENNDVEKMQRDSLNMHALSFILHPSHKASTPGKSLEDGMESNNPPSPTIETGENGRIAIVARASHALGVTPSALEKLIVIYFENMTAVNLFHQPSFWEKLQNIPNPAHTNALLASIVAFSSQYCFAKAINHESFDCNDVPGMNHPPSHFLNLASRHVTDAVEDHDDEAPALCLLQALVLVTHGLLTQGVRGKAWRSLGTCVRLAYELNLHLVDAGTVLDTPNLRSQCNDEEKRRLWWAIWEMDVFASTVRRCPTAVDWSQIETLLPVEDILWFQGTMHASCFLKHNFLDRLISLQDSGNKSAKAWFIVINSLMKEAQSISSPRGIPYQPPSNTRPSAISSQKRIVARGREDGAREKLETISNLIHCFSLAIPPTLKFRNQYLSFDARSWGQPNSNRQQHSDIYGIHIMTQLAKLMVYQYGIFSDPARTGNIAPVPISRTGDIVSEASWSNSTNNNGHRNDGDIFQYFEAADEILKIVHRSCDNHIQYINAFLASTIWLASAVQLVRKEFGPPGTNRSLVKSKFEVLNMTYKKCVAFWNIKTAMQRNLELLATHLEAYRDQAPEIERRNLKRNELGTIGAVETSPTRVVTFERPFDNDSSTSSTLTSTVYPLHIDRGLPLIPTARAFTPASDTSSIALQPTSKSRILPQRHGDAGPETLYSSPLSPALSTLSTLDYLHLHSSSDQPKWTFSQPESYAGSNCNALDGLLPGANHALLVGSSLAAERNPPPNTTADVIDQLSFEWQIGGWNTEIPNFINELLSGPCMY